MLGLAWFVMLPWIKGRPEDWDCGICVGTRRLWWRHRDWRRSRERTAIIPQKRGGKKEK